MEWLISNWEIVAAALGTLFYFGEKIVKESKKTEWQDILFDGIKWLAGKKPTPKGPMMLLLVLPFLASCAMLQPATIPEECAGAFLMEHREYYKLGSLVIKMGNSQALAENVYTKQEALDVLNDIEGMLHSKYTTYKDFAAYVLLKIRAVNDKAKAQLFIMSDFLIDMRGKIEPIHPCDAELMLKDIQKFKMYTKMS